MAPQLDSDHHNESLIGVFHRKTAFRVEVTGTTSLYRETCFFICADDINTLGL